MLSKRQKLTVFPGPKRHFKVWAFSKLGQQLGDASAASPEPLGSSGGTVLAQNLRDGVNTFTFQNLGAAIPAPLALRELKHRAGDSGKDRI